MQSSHFKQKKNKKGIIKPRNFRDCLRLQKVNDVIDQFRDKRNCLRKYATFILSCILCLKCEILNRVALS